MVSLEGRGLLRVRAEFWNECIIFDREIRPCEREHLTLNYAIGERWALFPFHVRAVKANIRLLFQHSSLPTSFDWVGLLPMSVALAA